VIDYRPALRNRSGVGEATYQIARALLRRFASADTDPRPSLTLFSSSWKDRLALPPELAGAERIDRRVPVRALNFAWHRLGWPTVEALTGRRFDVAHSAHPLLMPARDAAQIVTIHDLDFLAHPERTRAEIRRDYPALVRDHARRADGILVPSAFTAAQVEEQLGVAGERVTVCPHGAPEWRARASRPREGYLLFIGTLEPRKNVGGLLDAYQRLLAAMGPAAPPLVLAGSATEACRTTLARIRAAPLEGRVRHVGYVEPDARYALYAGALALVQPSFNEGFWMPALEAMTVGVPVVASNRGALPEVVGEAAAVVDPDDAEGMASAMARILVDQPYADDLVARGIARARTFSWDRTADLVYAAYQRAIEARRGRRGGAP
jgi:glycosyltransferase involved in cell wall biosynthesis